MTKNLKNKREVFIALLFLFIGAISMYIYTQRDLQSNKELTDKIMANCGQAMTAASKLVKKCNQSKAEVVSCYSDLESCDQKEFNKRMEILSEDAKKLDSDLKNYTKELEGLLNAYKK